ncbi:expressed unknown protein [Seminavis robusta]|uniref:Uncharacterized protein n=1 Tax=Seminavis robusta TaxID=568900 RepID=A0A9N8E9V8_9STRA|nr:expressed unknown protein [Seminavis robusta]|eukprot:Sro655_g182290.1 n/a (208) ;mRNA; f:33774-34397
MIPTFLNEQVLCVSNDSTTTKPQHSTMKRTVHFPEEQMVVVHDVLARQDYTEEELSACFFAKGDYKSFKKSSIVTLQKWRAGELPAGGTTKHCMRGLECRTREGAQQRKELKQAARTALMTEIQRQMVAGVQDELELAAVYHRTCAPQQHQASIQGMCDQLEAQEYYTLAQAVAPKQIHSTTTTTNALQLQAILDCPAPTTVVGVAA